MKQSTLAFGSTHTLTSTSCLPNVEAIDLVAREDEEMQPGPSVRRANQLEHTPGQHARAAKPVLKQSTLKFTKQPLEIIELLSSDEEASGKAHPAAAEDNTHQKGTFKRVASPLRPDTAKRAKSAFSAVPLPASFNFSSLVASKASGDAKSGSTPSAPGQPSVFGQPIRLGLSSSLGQATDQQTSPARSGDSPNLPTSCSPFQTNNVEASSIFLNLAAAAAKEVALRHKDGRSSTSADVLTNLEKSHTAIAQTKSNIAQTSRGKAVQATLQAAFARAAERPQGSQSSAAFQALAIRRPKQLHLPSLVPPKAVESPRVELVKTRLPVANVMERIWLYETLIRFDVIKTPKKNLMKLDRFEEWTGEDIHTLLVASAIYLAGLKTLHRGTPEQDYTDLIVALRNAGRDYTKGGEAWHCIERLCEANSVLVADLEAIDLPQVAIDDAENSAVEDDSVTSSTANETLLDSRARGSRRAASTAACAKLTSFAEKTRASMQDEEDESGGIDTPISVVEEASDRSGDDASEDGNSGDQESNTSSSDDDEGDKNGRKSDNSGTSRNHERVIPRRTVVESSEEPLTRSESPLSSIGGNAKQFAATPNDDKVDAPQSSEANREQTEMDVEMDAKADAEGLPSLERRIALLSSFLSFIMQLDEINKELMEGVKEVQLAKKTNLEDFHVHLAEIGLDRIGIYERRDEMVAVGKEAEWNAEYAVHQGKLLRARLRWDVEAFLFAENHKARSGPIGRDADANEYWHLTEYNEEKPSDIKGHWAWSLLVLGSPSSVPQRSRLHGQERADTDKVLHSDQTPRANIQGTSPPNDNESREIDGLTKTQNPPATSEGPVGAQGKHERAFYAISSPEELQKLEAWLTHRNLMVEHEEKLADRALEVALFEKEQQMAASEVVRLATMLRASDEAQSSSSLGPAGDEEVNALRLARQERNEDSRQLSMTQTARRKSIAALRKRIKLYAEYHELRGMSDEED